MDKKRLKCSKCGCDELHFVNVPYSVKGESGILDTLKIFAWILLIIGIMLSFISIITFTQTTLKTLQFNLTIFIISIALTVFNILSIVTLNVIKYFIPYKNENKKEYICPCCGNVDAIENAIKNTDDTASS